MFRKIFILVIGAVILLAAGSSLTAQRMGRRGMDTFGSGFNRGGPRGRGNMASPQASTLPANDEEKKILSVLEGMNRDQSAGMMNVPTLDGRILRVLTESINAKNVVEIGTSNGYSGIWFCLALRTTGGKLITHDIDEGRASLAIENFKKAGVENIVTLVMGDAHETVKNLKDPIDILFLDADKEGYKDYLDKLLPLVRPGGLILAHNLDQLSQDFISAITTNPSLETIQLEGVTVTLKKRQGEDKIPENEEDTSSAQ